MPFLYRACGFNLLSFKIRIGFLEQAFENVIQEKVILKELAMD